MNHIILIGRLTADPELKFINTGVAISKFTIAINRGYKKDSNVVTDFIPIEVWGKKGEYCATYMEKGCLVAIEGSLYIDRYTDNLGQSKSYAKISATSVMKLNSSKNNVSNTSTNTSVDASTNTSLDTNTTTSPDISTNTSLDASSSTLANEGSSNFSAVNDDELPF